MFVDIHTHRKTGNSGTAIYNLARGEEPITGLFSFGIHPWQSEQYSDGAALCLLDGISGNKFFVAVGEIGLDRACSVPLEIQRELFEIQLNWADSHRKPAIIHCVKSYSDILQILKRRAHTAPLIMHAYRADKHIAKQLSRYNTYFSLGIRELSHPDAAEIPLKRLFLVTDDSGASIEETYVRASAIFNTDIVQLQQAIQQNFDLVFG